MFNGTYRTAKISFTKHDTNQIGVISKILKNVCDLAKIIIIMKIKYRILKFSSKANYFNDRLLWVAPIYYRILINRSYLDQNMF